MIYAMSDVHGSYERANEILQKHGLVDSHGDWRGRDATLVVTGDSVDRGPQGYKVVKMWRHLQGQAEQAGGRVVHLLGNHDMWMIGEVLFRRQYNGWVEIQRQGHERDIQAFVNDPDLVKWFQSCPVMCRVGNLLFQHADAMMYYLNHGDKGVTGDALISLINNRVGQLMRRADSAFKQGDVMTFARDWDNAGGLISTYLKIFKATHVVHGHSPMGMRTDPYYDLGGKAILIDGMMSCHNASPRLTGWATGEGRVRSSSAGMLFQLKHDTLSIAV